MCWWWSTLCSKWKKSSPRSASLFSLISKPCSRGTTGTKSGSNNNHQASVCLVSDVLVCMSTERILGVLCRAFVTCFRMKRLLFNYFHLSVGLRHETWVCECFILRTEPIFCAIPVPDFLSDSICSVMLDVASIKNRVPHCRCVYPVEQMGEAPLNRATPGEITSNVMNGREQIWWKSLFFNLFWTNERKKKKDKEIFV